MKSIFAIPELVLSIFRYDSEKELDYGTLGTVSLFLGFILYAVNFNNVDNLAVVLGTYCVGTALILVPFILKRIHNKRGFCIRFVIILELVLTCIKIFFSFFSFFYLFRLLTPLLTSFIIPKTCQSKRLLVKKYANCQKNNP